jgi:exonuclease SbcD
MSLTLLHTADWHIGRMQKTLDALPYDYLQAQKTALERLLTVVEAHNPDLILLAGDLYDTPRPRAEAEALVAEYLLKLTQHGKRLLIAIAGNHDTRTAFATYHSWASPFGIILIGTVQDTLLYHGQTINSTYTLSSPLPGVLKIHFSHTDTSLYLYTFPHLYTSQWPQAYELPTHDPTEPPKKIDYSEAWHQLPERFLQEEPEAYHIFLGHSFCVSNTSATPEDTPDDEELSLAQVGAEERHGTEKFHPKLHYVALGHLHRPHQVGNLPIYYPGSLLWYGPHHPYADRKVIIASWESPQAPPRIAFESLPLEELRPIVQKTSQEADIEELLSRDWPERPLLWLTWKAPNHLPTITLQALSQKYHLIYRYIPPERSPDTYHFTSEENALLHLLSQQHDELLRDFLSYKCWDPEEIQSAITYIFEKYANITGED